MHNRLLKGRSSCTKALVPSTSPKGRRSLQPFSTRSSPRAVDKLQRSCYSRVSVPKYREINVPLHRQYSYSHYASRKNKMATSASAPAAESQLEASEQRDVASWRPDRPRRFAPLSSDAKTNGEGGSSSLKGIIFDVDGTLCLPQNYMFREMRAALDIPKSTDILDHIRQLPSETDQTDPEPSSPQSRAQEAIRSIERNAMSSQRPQPGLMELMTYLEKRSVPKALCTRNFPAPVQHLIDTFLSDLKTGFDMIVTRETVGLAPKPSPEGLWAIAKNWGLDKEVDEAGTDDATDQDVLARARKVLGSGLIMVGDSIDDMAAGYRAGAATVLLVNEDNQWLAEHEYVDRPIMRLDELVDILENGFVGKN